MYPKEYSLLELASEARSAEVTDPGDKVFALLGLAKDAKGLRSNHSENPPTLQIDYRSSVRSVYIDIARAMIQSDGCKKSWPKRDTYISIHKNYPLGP